MASPDWLFDNILFRPWPGRWLAAEAFRQLCIGLSIGLSLGASGLWLLEERARRLGRPFSARVVRTTCVVFGTLSFLVYFAFFNPNPRYPAYYHRHELFHYYLGSKYFDELGYDRLYVCTAIAEVEAGRGEKLAREEIRDLGGTNELVPMSKTLVFHDPERCKGHFTPQRWRDFATDVAWFESVSRGEYWDHMKTDHGYNPPPVWTMTGKLLGSLAPAGDHFFKLLAAIDVLLQLAALLLVGWAFGLRTMTLAAVFWGCNSVAEFHWTGGAFLRQDWYLLLVAAVCFAKKRRFGLSGAALVWSASLRIFPILFFTGPAIQIGIELFRRRRLPASQRRFVLGSVVMGCVLLGASVGSTGADSYRAFAAHIRLHENTPLTNNVGLEMLLTHTPDQRMQRTLDNRLDDPVRVWKDRYTARARALRPLLLAISALEIAWMAWVLRRGLPLWVAMALCLPLTLSFLNLTCYYQCTFVIAAVLVRLSPALGPAYLALAAASQVLGHLFYWIDDEYAAQSLLFYAFALCTLYALSRPVMPSRRRV